MPTATAGPVAIGDLLVREGLVSREHLPHAATEARSNGFGVVWNLVKLGAVAELDVTKVLGRVYRVPAVDLSRFEVDARILRLLPSELAQRHSFVRIDAGG